jgi:hypothetical protein
MDVYVTIDRLVLDGLTLAPGDREVLGAALEAELTRLLSAGGLDAAWSAGAATPRISLAAPALAGSPAIMGTSIAQTVYGSLGPAGGER